MSANNFRCDECYSVPPTASPEYPERMRQIFIETRPDLVLCARDADTATLWNIMQADKSLPGKLPYGNLETILYALDKWQSFVFCQKHDLPFADTFAPGRSGDVDALREFAEKVGFPMIAKPIEGFASKGVFFVRNWDEAASFVDLDGYMFQEYLGAADAMDQYFEFLDGPKPLFAEAPNVNHHTCHIPISPRGEIGEIFVLRNHHNFGAVTRLQRVVHPELEALARTFAQAFVAEGGFGPLSVQFRQDRNGKPKAQEMNLRTTGSTFPRLMMGQDEIGYIIRDLLPGKEFPIYSRPEPAYGLIISKSLYSYPILETQMTALGESGHWQS